MTYSQNAPFRADVVGSYLRPAELKQARADFAAGKIDEAALKAVEDNAITELVAKQKAAGLHVITDGNSAVAGGISTACGASPAWKRCRWTRAISSTMRRPAPNPHA